MPFLTDLNIPLQEYPKLSAWLERLLQRPSWQKTQPSAADIEEFKSTMKTLMSQRTGNRQ